MKLGSIMTLGCLIILPARSPASPTSRVHGSRAACNMQRPISFSSWTRRSEPRSPNMVRGLVSYQPQNPERSLVMCSASLTIEQTNTLPFAALFDQIETSIELEGQDPYFTVPASCCRRAQAPWTSGRIRVR